MIHVLPIPEELKQNIRTIERNSLVETPTSNETTTINKVRIDSVMDGDMTLA